MANLRYRIAQQQTRFSIIQRFFEEVNEETPNINRQLINTRLEILESNWVKFQVEHENICNGEFGPFEEDPYIKTKTYERCLEFYIHTRAQWLALQESIEASNPSSRVSTVMAQNVPQSSRRFALPKLTLPDSQETFTLGELFSIYFRQLL